MQHVSTTGPPRRRSRLAVAALVPATLAASVLGACGNDEEKGEQAITVTGTEYAYEMPETIEGGAVTMDFLNTGGAPHEFALGRLEPGKTLDDLDAVLARGEEPPSWVQDIGGVPAMTPGEAITISRDLRPGTYAFVCFITTAEGESHYDLGMKREFTLEGDSGESLPEPDAVITAGDKGFDVTRIAAGEQTIELRNDASRGREFELVTFEPGMGPEDIEKWFRGGFEDEPPAKLLGAMQTIPSGTSVFLTATFEAGRAYLVQDAESGQSARFTAG